MHTRTSYLVIYLFIFFFQSGRIIEYILVNNGIIHFYDVWREKDNVIKLRKFKKKRGKKEKEEEEEAAAARNSTLFCNTIFMLLGL